MTASRTGDWIQTFTRVIFYPLDPRPEEINIRDIAHALSNQCRFAGHCRQFYSVAEHSVRVARELPAHLQLWGLLHDASEAYLVDLPRPLKRFGEMGRLYMLHEEVLMRCVIERFGLSPEWIPAEVKRMDTRLLMTEKRDLMEAQPKPWEDTEEEPLPGKIEPWLPFAAECCFLDFYFEVIGRKRPVAVDPNKPHVFDYYHLAGSAGAGAGCGKCGLPEKHAIHGYTGE